MEIEGYDLEWLQSIDRGTPGDAVPSLTIARLILLGLVSDEPGGLVVTQRGVEVLTEHFSLKRWGFPRAIGR